jgi:antitoxin HigA-1
MALRIGKLCGNGPELWINMQRAFDLAAAEKELASEIEKIPTLAEANTDRL